MSKEARNTSALDLMITSLPKMAVAIGTCVVFIYCAFIIHYFPSGLSVGDSLFFLFAALAFSFIYTALIYVGLIPVYSVTSFFKECKSWYRSANKRLNRVVTVRNYRRSKNRSIDRYASASCGRLMIAKVVGVWVGHIFIVIASIAPLLLLCVYLYDKDIGILSVHPAFATVASGMAIVGGIEILTMRATSRSASKERRNLIGWALIISGLLFPILMSPLVVEKLEKFTFRTLGVHIENAEVIASPEEFRVIQAVADKMNIPVFSCSVDGQGERMVSNVDVLWHSVGDRSLLAFRLPKKKEDDPPRFVKFEVRREGIRVVQSPDDTPLTSCLSMDTKVLFDTASSSVTQEGQLSLMKAIGDMERKASPYHLRIEKISITGHADRVVYQTKNMTNQMLSEQRANAVKEALIQLKVAQPIDAALVETIGVGASGGTENCRTFASNRETAECLASDRRVDIKIFLARPVDSSKSGKG